MSAAARAAALSEEIRRQVVELCGDDPVCVLTTDVGFVLWRARQIVEGRGRAITAGEMFAVGEAVGVPASEIMQRAEDALAVTL